MNTRGLTELGYLLFLDRYSKKCGTRESLKVGDTVLIQIDGQKIIGILCDLKQNKALVQVNNYNNDTLSRDAFTVDVEAIDKPLELDPAEMWQRVAQAVAEAEQTSEKFEEWHDKFKWLLEDWKFLPGGRILAAAGTDTELTYYNCYVIPSPKDSKDEIFKTLNVMTQIMSRGGGVGMNISSLRPRYAYTQKTHGRSSGAVSWGELYSHTTGLIEQAGSRRGALMLILNDWHPDVMEFVNSKRDMKRIINANISVGLSDAFMKAVELDDDWELKFPDTTVPQYDDVWDGDLEKWVAGGLPVKVWKTIRARDLWDAIINSAWASAEPGLWFRDRVNQYSNSQYYSKLIACNPCSEQGLGAWNVCLLGSINLSKFVQNVDGMWDIDWDGLETAVHYAVRFLDNIIDVTPYIYPEMEEVQKSERRVGLGTMGLAEVLIRMQLRYGSDDSIRFIDNLYRFITVSAYEESIMLAKEKGKFSKYSNQITVSKFIQNLPGSITDAISEYDLRNVTLITQAPTGTIGSMVDTSTGIEPFYYWEYERKGRFGSHNVRVKVYDEYMQAAIAHHKPGEFYNDVPELPDYFVTAQDLTPEDHVKVQAAIQRWVDSSISKTCNVPEDYTVEQVGELYKLMYELGCKGGTIYRDKSRSEQVLNLKPSTSAEQASTIITDKLSASLDKPRSEAYGKPESELAHQLEIRNRPAVIAGKTYKKLTPEGTCFITLNSENGSPFETFINIGKAGSDVANGAEAIGRLVSMAFRASNGNVMSCVTEVVSQLRGIGGKSVGFGANRVSSVADALAQVLEAEYLSTAVASKISLGELCPGCGNYTVMHIEGCKKCDNCGFSAC
jgi:ribonucleoside-diphosphate reductase alpha chain